jgi:hypothetical protein
MGAKKGGKGAKKGKKEDDGAPGLDPVENLKRATVLIETLERELGTSRSFRRVVFHFSDDSM